MINSFTKQNRFLSNFVYSPIRYEGIEYPTVEHAFQAAKTLNVNKRKYISLLQGPGLAKKAGRDLELRPDWDHIRVEVMEELLRLKFSIPAYRDKLLSTGDQLLAEGNTWGDTFWGIDVSKGGGQNNLGLLLMKIRRDLVKQ